MYHVAFYRSETTPPSVLSSKTHIQTSSFDSSGKKGYSFPHAVSEARQCRTADPSQSFSRRIGTSDSVSYF